MRLIWTILFAVWVLLGLQYSPWVSVASGILAVASYCFYPQLVRWWYRRHHRRLYESSGSPQFGACEFSFEASQVHVKTAAAESKINVDSIDRVESNENYLFVYLGPVQAIIVPRQRVSSGDFGALAVSLSSATGVPAA